MTREEAIERFENIKANALVQKASGVSEYWQNEIDGTVEAIDMAIEALSSDAIARAYNQGFVEGSVNATVNSNYVCPRCGKIMERKEGGDEE